jgi:hypothetical protein
MASCIRAVRGAASPLLYTYRESFVKLVRALVAAGATIAAAAAFQLTTTNASATDSADCITCWGSSIIGD